MKWQRTCNYEIWRGASKATIEFVPRAIKSMLFAFVALFRLVLIDFNSLGKLIPAKSPMQLDNSKWLD